MLVRFNEYPRKLQTMFMLRSLIHGYYEVEGCGGMLHNVLDDHNVENRHIEFCVKYAKEHNTTDRMGLLISELLMELSENERTVVIEHGWLIPIFVQDVEKGKYPNIKDIEVRVCEEYPELELVPVY